MKVAIVDYGLCNLDSIARAVDECGGAPVVTDRPEEIRDAARVILPGVGAFPDAMKNLRQNGLVEALDRRVREDGVPFLGVCLGMQLLARRGLEFEPTTGLGWIDAEVVRLEPSQAAERVPHIGWNAVAPRRSSKLFDGVAPNADFYFVHSYHMVGAADAVLAETPYCGSIVSAVEQDNIAAVQFHPEKSQRVGFQLLRNFLAS